MPTDLMGLCLPPRHAQTNSASLDPALLEQDSAALCTTAISGAPIQLLVLSCADWPCFGQFLVSAGAWVALVIISRTVP